MLKVMPVQSGLHGPEPQLGLCMAGVLLTGTKTGQTVATTQCFTLGLSTASKQRAVLGVTCAMGWQAVAGGMSPLVLGTHITVLLC